MEERCAVCRKSGSVVPLLDGILNDEVVKICEGCAQMEDVTIVRRPTSFQIAEAQKPYTVYQRLSRMAGVNKNPGTNLPPSTPVSRGVTLDKLRPSRDFSDRMKKKKIEPLARPLDLVENYNWTIQMERRKRKITINQLGADIGEDPEVLKFIEQGMLTSDAERIISKLEQYLRIRIRKGKLVEPNEQPEKQLDTPSESGKDGKNYLLGADIEIEDE